MRLPSVLALAVALAGCSRPVAIPPVALPFPVDSITDRVIADGVVYRSIRSARGPWAIQVLDVDLSRCWSPVAVKGASGAVGRKKTSVLLEELRATKEVIGGVNADFFTLAGFQGVPTGALISNSRVVVGPGAQPVFAVEGSGLPRLGALRATVTIKVGAVEQSTASWNRPGALTVYDANWGAALDTASGAVEVTVDRSSSGTVVAIDTTVRGAAIPPGGVVIVASRSADARQRSFVLGLKPGDRVEVSFALSPFHPVEAVGGRPMLARDSAIVAEVETEGQASFRARNPRTAAGIGNGGRRLILAVIDGRQAPYSDGMTLRETAELMLGLGARDAINLDGGGSSALVFLEPDTKRLRVANKPSDATGERAVGDALAIVKGCARPR